MKKYIKVSVSERLPHVRTDVVVLWTNEDQTYSAGAGFVTEKGYWWVYDSDCSAPEYWLEEVDDHEGEMRDMLEECRLQLEHLNKNQRGTTNAVLSRLENLLNKLKS